MGARVTLFQMPRGFFPLYTIQIFSTISFAVLYSTLVLYMKQKLGMSSHDADIITGVYFAYNFALHLFAGAIAGRFFSYRSLVAVGVVAQLIGCLFLARVSTTDLYIGLALMLVGTGTMVTCLNMLLSQLFEPGDARREYAFLWNYSGMNVGFMLGFSLAGYYQLRSDYHALFTMVALTNLLALAILFFFWRALRDRQTILTGLPGARQRKRFGVGMGILLVLTPLIYFLLHHPDLSGAVILIAGVCIVCFLFVLSLGYSPEERKRMFAFILLLLFAQIFWVIYQLAPMGLMFFAQYNVDRHLFGFLIAPAWIQNINSVTIVVGGPIMAAAFQWLRRRGRGASVPLQYSIGLLLAAVGLLLLPLGIAQASAAGYIAFAWLLVSYVLLAIAELFLSPIGYSMVGLLAPPRLQSLMMGMVLLNVGVAAVLASFFSNYAMGRQEASVSPLVTNPSYSHAFSQLGLVTLVIAVALFVLTPLVNKRLIQPLSKMHS